MADLSFSLRRGCLAACVCLFMAGAAVGQDRDGGSNHKVVSIDGTPQARQLAVRLDRRLTEAALSDLALRLKDKLKAGEVLHQAAFYLPRQPLSQAPWATVTAGTSPQVAITGLRAEEEAAYRHEAQLETREVVGVWLTAPPALPGKLTILRRKDGGYIAEWHLRSGQRTTDDLKLTRVAKGRRFDVVAGDGAFYLAAWSGDLMLGDGARVIAVAERLDIGQPPAPVAAGSVAAPQSAGKGPGGKVAVPAASAAAAQAVTAPSAQGALAVVPQTANPAAARLHVKSDGQSSRASKTAAARKPRPVADLMGGSFAR